MRRHVSRAQSGNRTTKHEATQRNVARKAAKIKGHGNKNQKSKSNRIVTGLARLTAFAKLSRKPLKMRKSCVLSSMRATLFSETISAPINIEQNTLNLKAEMQS